jgi:Polyketide cyclase / dehydrase and lipid transport/Protein of unknown function (DUF2934)
MGTTTHSIDVKAPLKSVYNQWTQFEEFPRFMRDVVEVRQHGPGALSWKVLMGGKEKQWEARIIEQIPDTSIVWESVDGTSNRGAVTFEPLGTDGTRLTVVMEYEPEGFLEKAGDLLGVPSGRVEESLKSFRELIENKSTDTRGWRGRIESTDLEEVPGDKDMVTEPGPTAADGFRANNEAETFRQEVPVTETGRGEYQAAMVARPNDTDQELQNSSLSEEPETPSVKVHTSDSVPDRAFQAVPVTDLESGEHEAGMIARVSEPDQQEIALRAYDLYLARGQAAGHETDDWIEAKRQLLEERKFPS